MPLSLSPRNAKCLIGKTAWWYDERGGISVYVTSDGITVACFIRRSAILKYLERSKKPTARRIR